MRPLSFGAMVAGGWLIVVGGLSPDASPPPPGFTPFPSAPRPSATRLKQRLLSRLLP